MRHSSGFFRSTIPGLIAVFLIMAWSSFISFAQDHMSPPFGDRHVGGDVPVDEVMAEASRPLTPPMEGRVLKRGVLALSKDDRTAFAAFLRMPNTGLLRLFPLESPNPPWKRSFQRTAPVCAACYSFANSTHFSGYGADIVLGNGNLSVGFGGLSYGLLTNLGDVPLAHVTLSDPHTRFITSYSPAGTLVDAREEAVRFKAAETIDGMRYQDVLPVEVNATYLLRSVNYGKRVFALKASTDPVRDARRTDVLVAFRVVRKDHDGSLIIAWELLKKYPAPKIK